jgi:hypothetical protein
MCVPNTPEPQKSPASQVQLPWRVAGIHGRGGPGKPGPYKLVGGLKDMDCAIRENHPSKAAG